MKVTYLTADKKTLEWSSLDDKLAEITRILNTGKNANFEEVTIKYKEAEPEVVNERIVHSWLNDFIRPEFQSGSDIIPFHFSLTQRNKWGIEPTLRGANPITDDEMGDMYFWANEKTKRNGYNQFIETSLHEMAHEYFKETGLTDITHLWHDRFGTIEGLFSTLDWSLYQPKRMGLKKQVSLFERIVELYKLLSASKEEARLIHPVSEYSKLISQGYGVKNDKWYPTTGHHLGTDYACPVGTKVLAPFDGEVIVSGVSNATGNFCHYQYNYKGQVYVARFMHLSSVPTQGEYRQGEALGKTGNSGLSTGPHLHVDVWLDEVRLDLLDKKSWATLTVDPVEHYKN